MDLHSERLDVVGTGRSACEVRQVELDLVPPIVQSHGHGANERLDTSGTLIVRGSESSSHVLVIEYLDFESEIFFQL